MSAIAQIIGAPARTSAANAGITRSTLTVTRRALLRYLRTPQLIVIPALAADVGAGAPIVWAIADMVSWSFHS